MQTIQRRVFITQCAAALAATGSLVTMTTVHGAPRNRGAQPGSLRLGGPVFVKTDDPKELALAHRRLGYRAAYCPNLPLSDPQRLRAFSSAFAEQDVVLAEVGRWCNLLDPDAVQRQKNFQNVTEGLALAEAVGALCCVDIAGSFNPKVWYGPHPENLSPGFFDAAVENARKLIDAVKPKRARFCYEMMGWSLPDSADSYRKMLKAVDRRAFGVHLDPCNLINTPARFYQNTALLQECFDKLGPHIVSCHAKDLTWDVEMNVHFREVRPGLGTLDYATFLRGLSRLPRHPPLMIEHLSTAEEYDQARQHMVAIGQKEGLRF
jgi:sugar phosphate isomerase/epimerase